MNFGRRFAQYSGRRHSGIEWAGTVPAHWKDARVSELARVINGFPFDSEHFARGEGTPLVRIRDLNSTDTEVGYIGPIVEDAWIETGDVIVGMDGDFNVARWRGPRALLNQHMCCLRPRAADAGFLAYVLPYPLQLINDLTHSTTVKHLSSGQVRKIHVALPPLEEQRAIAAFLDRETAKIDALVAKKERLIKLLHQKRGALVTRAVTRGFTPSTMSTASAITWLGPIPSHWRASRIKYVATIRYGLAEPPREAPDGLPFIRATNISHGRICTDSLRLVDPSDVPLSRDAVLRTNDIIVVRSGAYTGDSAIIPPPYDGSIVGFDMVVRARKVQPQFLAWTLLSDYVQAAQVDLEKARAAQPHLNAEELGGVTVLVPPAEEQVALSTVLEASAARIDALVERVENAIASLRDLHFSLVYAAVTGKIDVRAQESPSARSLTRTP